MGHTQKRTKKRRISNTQERIKQRREYLWMKEKAYSKITVGALLLSVAACAALFWIDGVVRQYSLLLGGPASPDDGPV